MSDLIAEGRASALGAGAAACGAGAGAAASGLVAMGKRWQAKRDED